MVNCIALALALVCYTPEQPAYFQFDVETRTPYSLFIDGDPIQANTKYKTEPLAEVIRVEVEVRYVDGGDVVSRKFFVDIKPGKTCRLKIIISAIPQYARC